jgi:hypothetical protein
VVPDQILLFLFKVNYVVGNKDDGPNKWLRTK